MTTKLLLAAASTFEAVTGFALVIAPSIVRFLLWADISGAVLVIARIVGVGLLLLGVACWPRIEGTIPRLRAMFIYNLLAVPRPLVEDRAESLLVKAHPESELLGKLCDLSLAIFLLRRPEPLQFFLVNGAVFPFADLQLAFDVGSKRFRANADLAQVAIGLSTPL